MGMKGSWFSAVKKIFTPDSRKDKKHKNHKSKKKCIEKNSELAPEEARVAVAPPHSPIEDVNVKLITEAENEQSKHAISLALATTVTAGAAVAAAQAAVEAVRLTSMPHYPEKTKEEMASIKIQTAFRGYLARRALRALRGLVRLKTLIQRKSVKQQAASTLRCMQTLARLQSQVHERRIRMSEENRALQRQLQQKHEKELEKLRAAQVGEEWDDSLQSKEQIEAKLLQRQEAALKREKALAYSFSHQKSSKSINPTFMDPNNPHWGWSWLERWMAARPWEGHNNHDNKPSPVGLKARPSATYNSLSTPASKAPSSSSCANGKPRPSSSKSSSAWGGNDDSRSMFSVQSERYHHRRRYSSIAGSSLRDDDNESLTSSLAFPSYTALTSSAKAKSKALQRQSPLSSSIDRTDKRVVFSAKKRLSFPAISPAGSRRHSGPPKV